MSSGIGASRPTPKWTYSVKEYSYVHENRKYWTTFIIDVEGIVHCMFEKQLTKSEAIAVGEAYIRLKT